MPTKSKNKNILVYIVLLIVVFFVAFLSYYLGSRKTENTYSFIPGNAVMVWESLNTYKSIERLKGGSVWNNLEQTTFYESIQKRLTIIDSATKNKNDLSFILKDKYFRCSMHITSNNDFDFIFYLPLRSKDEKQFYRLVIEKFEASDKHNISERAYQKIPITTIKNKQSGDQFSFIQYQNHLIGSMTPFLIEDVIRHISDKKEMSFYDINKKNFEVARINNDDGDLYININRFAEFLKCFTKDEYSEDLDLIKLFSESSFYDLSVKGEKIYLNGSSIPSKGINNFLDIFKNESGNALDLAPYLPMNTAIYYGFSFDNGISFQQNFKTFLKNSGQNEILESWYNLSVDENIYIEKIFEFLGTHFAYVTLESVNPAKPIHLFYMQSNDPNSNLDYLDAISTKFSKIEDGNIPFEEDYGGVKISEMMKADYPQLAFSKYFGGFDKCYYLKIHDYIIFVNDIAAARQLIDDINDEKVWGKSVKQNLFLEEVIQKTNVNIIINTARSWSLIKNVTSDYWKELIENNSESLKRFEMIALQYEYLDEKFYTGAVIQHKKTVVSEKKSKEYLKTLLNRRFDHTLITKPKVVRNFTDNSLEILVQDTQKQLHLLNKSGIVKWTKQLDGQLLPESIYQLDYYKNGKLQYCFSDDKNIYLIDRNGNYIEDFPKRITKDANQELKYFNVIDYDNSKNYRFICSDNKGQVFITDKNGKKLESWNPLKLNSELASKPQHTRMLDKDIIVLLTKNGKLDLRKRNGKSYSSFPLDLYNRVNTDYYIDLGKDFKSSKIHIIDEEGLLRSVNFNGDILSEIQFFRPTKETKFELISDGLGKSYCIVRFDNDVINFYRPDNKPIFDIAGDPNSIIQYYNFGADNEVFVIIDRNTKLVSFLNSKGENLNPEKIQSSNKIGLMYFDSYEQFRVYKAYDTEVSLITFDH
ncbi:hypothetical protein HZR84_13710 [Hyphobacterium sp. CCMP332]|nr:hypothetical protein HZR84_13710 [Hyphobacterium sp. CCMP332]